MPKSLIAPEDNTTNRPHSQKECPSCGATRFEKREVYEIVNGEERLVELEYRCYNHHTHTLEKLVDRDLATVEA